MRVAKMMLSAVALVGVLAGAAPDAVASGGGGSCVVGTRSELSTKTMTGTAVVELLGYDQGSNQADRLDATLTLTFGRQTAVFRTSLGDGLGDGVTASALTPEQVMCDVLNANPTAAVPVDTNGDGTPDTTEDRTIFQVFGLPTPAHPTDSLKLCLIVERSTRGDRVVCQSIEGLDFAPIPGTASDATGAAKLLIYVFP